MKSSKRCRVEEDMGRTKSVLKPDLPLCLLREGLLGAHHQQVRNILDVVRKQELGQMSGRNLTIHVPGSNKYPDVPVRELSLKFLSSQ